jgi:hypothetical protein
MRDHRGPQRLRGAAPVQYLPQPSCFHNSSNAPHAWKFSPRSKRLIAITTPRKPVCAGRAGAGFNIAKLEPLWRRLQPIATGTMPLNVPPPGFAGDFPPESAAN